MILLPSGGGGPPLRCREVVVLSAVLLVLACIATAALGVLAYGFLTLMEHQFG